MTPNYHEEFSSMQNRSSQTKLKVICVFALRGRFQAVTQFVTRCVRSAINCMLNSAIVECNDKEKYERLYL